MFLPTSDLRPGRESLGTFSARFKEIVGSSPTAYREEMVRRGGPPRIPGCFVMMGQQGPDKGGVPVHHPAYDFNDAMLPVGASYFATLVEQELRRG